MSSLLPKFNRRVYWSIGVLAIAIVSRTIHRNIISDLLISILGIALAVWLGTELSRHENGASKT